MVNGGNSKNPIIAAILSFFIPGLGQVYSGESFLKGLMFLAGTIIGYLLLIIPGLAIWLYGIYNAYSTAKKVNAGILPYKDVSAGTLIIYAVLGFVIIFVGVFIITMVLVTIIAAFFFSTSSVVSGPY
ncbi:MAG: hypothetical protein WBZ29_09850 [Methanocella sp.]